MMTGHDARCQEAPRFEWALATSRNYTEADIQMLLGALEREGIDVTQHYDILRKSADWLPPAVDIALTVVGGIAGGVLGAMGADLWAKLKNAVGIAQNIDIDAHKPEVTVTLELEVKRFRLVVAGDDPEHVSEILDRALPKMESLAQSHTLWYEPEVGEWVTLDEKLEWQEDMAKRRRRRRQ